MNDQKKNIKIGGIIENRDLILISIHSAPNQPGVAGKVLNLLGDNGINVEFITESCNIENCADISFCIKREYQEEVKKLYDKLKELVKAQGERWIKNIGIVGIFGPHFREKPCIAGQMCSAFGDAGINILGISTSISTVSCVINDCNVVKAKKAIQSRFLLPE